MITNDNIKAPDLLIAELKQKGLKNKDIAVQVFPDLPIKSAEVKVSRYLTKGTVAQYLNTSREEALKELKVNWYELLQVFTDALRADKTVVHGKDEDSWVEVVPDHQTRMSGAKELVKHMPEQSPALEELPNMDGLDEVELKQAIFRRSK